MVKYPGNTKDLKSKLYCKLKAEYQGLYTNIFKKQEKLRNNITHHAYINVNYLNNIQKTKLRIIIGAYILELNPANSLKSDSGS